MIENSDEIELLLTTYIMTDNREIPYISFSKPIKDCFNSIILDLPAVKI